MSSSTSYYDDPEFKRVLRRYEEACADGQHVYLDADDFADIVDYYLSRDRLDEADACVTYALTLHPDHTRLLVQLAKKYIDEGNIQEAQNVEASIHDAEDYNAKLLHAEILLYNFEFEKADNYLGESFTALGDLEDIDDVLDVAALLLDYEQPKRAAAWLAKLKDLKFDRAYYYYLLSLCHLQSGRYDDSVAVANQCLDLDPYDGACWGVLASAQFEKQEYRKAVDSADYALAIWPQDASALRVKAKSLYELHDYAAVHEVLSSGLELHGSDVDFLLLDGMCLNALSRPEEALVRLKKAGSLSPGGSTDYLLDIYRQLAYAYSLLGDEAETLSCLEQVVRLGGDASLLDLQYVHNDFADGREQEALQRAAGLFDDGQADVSVRLHLTLVLSDYGYAEMASRMLERLENEDGIAGKGLYAYRAYVSRKLGHTREYLQFLEKACELSPDRARDLFQDVFPGLDPSQYVAAARKRMEEGDRDLE